MAKMKKFEKIFTTFIVACLLVSICSISVFAADYSSNYTTAYQKGHKDFSSSWKDYATLKVAGHYYDFTIGFDTFNTDEDYINDVYSQADNGKTYYGKIKNHSGTTAVTNKVSGKTKTGKADVTHTGKTVIYYVYAR